MSAKLISTGCRIKAGAPLRLISDLRFFSAGPWPGYVSITTKREEKEYVDCYKVSELRELIAEFDTPPKEK